jgi:hypothetical protein
MKEIRPKLKDEFVSLIFVEISIHTNLFLKGCPGLAGERTRDLLILFIIP